MPNCLHLVIVIDCLTLTIVRPFHAYIVHFPPFSRLPEHVTLLACFEGEPAPIKSAVTKAVAEFRRTHIDT